MSATTRTAFVRNADSRQQIDAYLPNNYRVVAELGDGKFIIQGEDHAGWTMEDYVIPRAASGLIWIEEIKEGEVVVEGNLGHGVVYGSLALFTVLSSKHVTVTNLSFEGNQAVVNNIPVDFRFTFKVEERDHELMFPQTSTGAYVLPDFQSAYRTDGDGWSYSRQATDSQRRNLLKLVGSMVAKLPARAYLAGQNASIEREIASKQAEIEEMEKDVISLKQEIRDLQIQLEAGLLA